MIDHNREPLSLRNEDFLGFVFLCFVFIFCQLLRPPHSESDPTRDSYECVFASLTSRFGVVKDEAAEP